jgi:hypothetical protein
MEAIKKTIADLKEAIQSAKEKQKVAKEECKKLEKDMDEFKNNKEGKIDELKVCSFVFDIVHLQNDPMFYRPTSQSRKRHSRNTLSSSRRSKKNYKQPLWS